jgi:protein dithiol oxidoreductase (disulfide-forming)
MPTRSLDMTRVFLIALSLIASVFALPLQAQELELGKHYTLIDPPLASSAPTGKIEVVEFFSYGCNHCNDFHPLVAQWQGKLAKDVSFRRVPVSFGRPAWEKLSSIYYGLEATGQLAKLDSAVFKAVHQERMNFNSNEAITGWVSTHGGDAKKMNDALNGFSMKSQIRRGDDEAKVAKIGGVPAMVVGGKYLVNNAAATGYEDLLRITDALVAKARSGK